MAIGKISHMTLSEQCARSLSSKNKFPAVLVMMPNRAVLKANEVIALLSTRSNAPTNNDVAAILKYRRNKHERTLEEKIIELSNQAKVFREKKEDLVTKMTDLGDEILKSPENRGINMAIRFYTPNGNVMNTADALSIFMGRSGEIDIRVAKFDEIAGRVDAQKASMDSMKQEFPIILPEMVFLSAGSFLMGSNKVENEGPERIMEISTPFEICVHKIMNENLRPFYKAIGREIPMSMADKRLNKHRVSDLDWFDPFEFCKWLGQYIGDRNKEVAMANEAELEYAARSGVLRDFSEGREWVYDRYKTPYDPKDVFDPTSHEMRVMRGGSSRVTERSGELPNFHKGGFRFVIRHLHLAPPIS